MRAIVLALFIAPAIAGANDNLLRECVRLFKADARDYHKNGRNEPWRAYIVQDARRSIDGALASDCEKKKCAKPECWHKREARNIQNAALGAKKR